MAELDKDKSGKLEKEEFIKWWLDRVLPPENYRRQQEVIARNVFMRSGGADDRQIDIGELEDLAANLGLPLSPEELSRAMERLDTNGDGTLQQEEFVTWWVEKSMNWEIDDELSKKLRKLAETARRRLSTDIHTAAWQGDMMLVEEFLKADPALVNAEDTSEYGEKYRPLHYAAYQGNLPLCQLLVQNGAKVMAPTATGCHAIVLAAQQDHAHVVRFLLEEGSDPSVCETERGLCAVDVAEYSPAALQVFKEFGRLSKPDKPAEAPELRSSRGSALQLHVPEHHRTGPFQLPVQELKVKVLMHEEGVGDKMVSLAIFPAKPTPIILKDLQEQSEYRVQVAYLNGLGAGPYSDPSEPVTTGSARSHSRAEGEKENTGGEENRSTGRHSANSTGSTASHSSAGPGRSPSPTSTHPSSSSLKQPQPTPTPSGMPTAGRNPRRPSRGAADPKLPAKATNVDAPRMAAAAADDVTVAAGRGPADMVISEEDVMLNGPKNLLAPLQPSRPIEAPPENPRMGSFKGQKVNGLAPLTTKADGEAVRALDALPDIDIDF